jgi:hypothetical protein
MHVKQSPVDNARGTVSSTLGGLQYAGNVSFPIVYGAHINNAFPTITPLPTQGRAFLSGSSMSAPFVAAAAAWFADVYGYTTPGAVEVAIRNNALNAVAPGESFAAVPVVRMP